MQRLVTERLFLRDWQLSDSTDLFEYSKQSVVGENGGWKPHDSEEESQEIIKWFISSNEVWALEHKVDQKVIGSIGLHNRYPENDLVATNLKQAEIGYVLHPDYWGRGLTPEAKRVILQYAFDIAHVDVIWCGHFDYNHQAKRVSDKCGLKFRFRTQKILTKLNDKLVNIDYYSIDKQQFITKYGNL